MKLPALVSIILVVLLSSQAGAWPTRYYTDAQVVERAELILLAHVKAGSIQRVLGSGRYEHHATLVISKIIKGEYKDKELPITIDYGLLPVASRYRAKLNLDRGKAEEPGEATVIYEDNASEGYFRPSGDVHQEQIWLLHRLGSQFDPKNSQFSPTGSIGIKDREDLQPPEKEPALVKYIPSPNS